MPSSGSSSLLTPPIRLELPAAATKAEQKGLLLSRIFFKKGNIF